MSAPFNNNSTKAEREQFVKDSYHNRYQDEAGGRWQKQTPTQFSGKDPATLYPKLPSNSPWSNPIEAVEPPLGIDVSEPVVTGESWEVEKSLDERFELQRSLRDGAPERFITPHPDAPDKVTSPASSGPASSPTSLSKTSTVSEKEGDGNTNGGREGPSPSRSNLKRRLV